MNLTCENTTGEHDVLAAKCHQDAASADIRPISQRLRHLRLELKASLRRKHRELTVYSKKSSSKIRKARICRREFDNE